MSTNRLPPIGQPSNGDEDLSNCLRQDGHGQDDSGFTPPPDVPPVISQCWSCNVEIRNAAQGVSLTGQVPGRALEFQCCNKCWAQVGVAERLQLTRDLRSGLPQTLEGLKSLVELAIREYTPRSPGGYPGGYPGEFGESEN